MGKSVATYCEEDNEFYPTPLELVQKMVSDIRFDEVESILEPSAGKGNIVYGILRTIYDGGYGRFDSRFKNVYIDCVENDPHLRSILQYEFSDEKYDSMRDEYDKYVRYGKMSADEEARYEELKRERAICSSDRVRIVGSDFLSFETFKKYDVIVMNPPFSNGELHLMKAIEIQERYGGDIVCILNAETIRNPYTNSRKMLMMKLNKYGAKIEYLQEQFAGAERQTDVEIAIIKLKVPRKEPITSFIFGELEKARELEQKKLDPQEVIDSNPVQQMIDQYNFEVKGCIRLIEEYEAIYPYMLTSLHPDDNYSHAILTLTTKYGGSSYSQGVNVNEYLKLVRMKYWNAFFTNKEFVGALTSNLQKEFYGMVEEMAEYEFSMFNIQRVLQKMNKSLTRGVEDTILATFDELSAEHAYFDECSQNIHYYSGWKTNKAHKINTKVIIPIYGAFAYDSWYKKYDDKISVNTIYDKLSDIEKSLNYLDMGNTGEAGLRNVLEAAANRYVSKKIECKYFRVTFYKKGTCHIEFTNQDLLDKLNIYGSQRKGWLPPSYGKKHYSDMDTEEKAVIDEFQGAEEYAKVMARADYFLSDQNEGSPLMLLAGG